MRIFNAWEKIFSIATVIKAKSQGYEVNICEKTLYNYVNQKLFYKLEAKDLPYKKRKNQRQRAKSIEDMGLDYYYSHSYCSYERGSKENNNKFKWAKNPF